MDIVVTIPKLEYKNDDLENKDIKEKDYNAFWTIGRIPKRLEVGNRVYFTSKMSNYR